MGFKAEQFVKSVDENLFCSICHEVFEDPVSCKDGHAFCRDCIHEWLKTNKTCPLQGNRYLSKRNLVPQFTIKGIINNLVIYCHPLGVEYFEEEICDWVGKLQHLTQHRKTCPFQEVKCSHEKCSQTIPRIKLADHEKICDFRQVKCEKCGMILCHREKEKHIKDDCLQVLVCCPNQCKDNQQRAVLIKRVEIDNHINTICPETMVSCPFKEQGCSVRVERNHVDLHLQDNRDAHMMLLAKQCSSLSKQISSLTENNTILSEQCSALSEECSELNLRCWSLTRENQHLQEELSQVKENCSYTWTLNDFPTLATKHHNGSACTSPLFWLCGHKLNFLIYPNGADKESEGWVSLYLALSEEYPKPHNYFSKIHNINNATAVKYRVSVKSIKLDGKDDLTYDAIHLFNKPGDWGWSKLMKTNKALSLAYCNSTNGSLTIQCTIQPNKQQ